MTTYKFRAESLIDVEFFAIQNSGLVSNFGVAEDAFPETVEIIFDSPLTLPEIIESMRKIEGSHVMFQTLKPINEYTGDRDYSI